MQYRSTPQTPIRPFTPQSTTQYLHGAQAGLQATTAQSLEQRIDAYRQTTPCSADVCLKLQGLLETPPSRDLLFGGFSAESFAAISGIPPLLVEQLVAHAGGDTNAWKLSLPDNLANVPAWCPGVPGWMHLLCLEIAGLRPYFGVPECKDSVRHFELSKDKRGEARSKVATPEGLLLACRMAALVDEAEIVMPLTGNGDPIGVADFHLHAATLLPDLVAVDAPPMRKAFVCDNGSHSAPIAFVREAGSSYLIVADSLGCRSFGGRCNDGIERLHQATGLPILVMMRALQVDGVACHAHAVTWSQRICRKEADDTYRISVSELVGQKERIRDDAEIYAWRPPANLFSYSQSTATNIYVPSTEDPIAHWRKHPDGSRKAETLSAYRSRFERDGLNQKLRQLTLATALGIVVENYLEEICRLSPRTMPKAVQLAFVREAKRAVKGRFEGQLRPQLENGGRTLEEDLRALDDWLSGFGMPRWTAATLTTPAEPDGDNASLLSVAIENGSAASRTFVLAVANSVRADLDDDALLDALRLSIVCRDCGTEEGLSAEAKRRPGAIGQLAEQLLEQATADAH